MGDNLAKFKELDYNLPEKNLVWRMYDSGVENFGKDGVDTLDLLKPKADEVLLRVDAIGICFSDVKLITQGPNHARITGRDLANDPVTPGHEVSLTVIEAGENYKNQYTPGERYIMQADVFYKGASLAYGYVLPGGMQQYSLVGKEVLDGDEGSYLIPVKSDIGYAEAALVEPWTCVVAAYRIFPRRNLTPNGTTLIVGIEDGNYIFDEALVAKGAPSKVIFAGCDSKVINKVSELCAGAEFIVIEGLGPCCVKALSEERTGDKGFDDAIILGTPSAELAEELGKKLAKHAIMAIVAKEPMERALQIDVGRVHYDFIDYVGTNSNTVSEAYTRSRDSEFKPGGTAWFIGAAGPMGQMHVQRAILMKNGPKKILCSDVDNGRLNYLKESLKASVDNIEAEVIFVNPLEEGTEKLDQAINKITDGKGFDDIVVLAPVAALITSSVGYLAEGGLMNIFAGVPIGTIATIDLTGTYAKGCRFVGSSGSKPIDMVDTLRFTENGEIPTRNSMAAVGGIDAMADGVKAVKEARFPGKTIIFPHIKLPLTALTDLDKVLPNVYSKLVAGKFWTKEAEEELLESKLEY